MIRNLVLTIALITSFSFPDSKFDNVYEKKYNLSNSNIYESSNLWNHNSTEEEKEEYLFFCNGIPCQHHDVKKVIKDISAEGRYIYYSSDELVDLDFSTLEDWQIIRYSLEELEELNIMPEDCTQSSVDNGTCGFGIVRNIEFVEYRTTNDPPLLKGIDMNPFTDVLHLELNPGYIENGYDINSYGCKVILLENDNPIHTYLQTVNDLNCYFNIPEELQGNRYHIEIYTFLVFEDISTGTVSEIFRFMAEVGTND